MTEIDYLKSPLFTQARRLCDGTWHIEIIDKNGIEMSFTLPHLDEEGIVMNLSLPVEKDFKCQ